MIAHLTSLAPVVVFSAAIPGQGGTDHINEQWQDYWRAAFSAQGYTALDLVRPQIWRNEAADFWYGQNLIVYASLDAVARYGLTPVTDEMSWNFVHPKLLALAREEGQM